MHGGPSHVDTFDYRPELQKRSGQRLPFAPAKNLDPAATSQAKLMGSPWKFRQHGESGLWVSELFPEVAKRADDLCVIRSVHSKGQSHGQAVCMLHTGTDNFVRPSVGAWVSYGLGTENRDLPAFVSISPSASHGGPRTMGRPFSLPRIRPRRSAGTESSPRTPRSSSSSPRRPIPCRTRKLELLQQINGEHFQRTGYAPIEGMIRSMEMAFRMQSVAPPVIDISQEPEHVRQLYGIGEKANRQLRPPVSVGPPFCRSGSALHSGVDPERLGPAQQSPAQATRRIRSRSTSRSPACSPT